MSNGIPPGVRHAPGPASPVPDGARDVLVVGGGIIGLTVAWRAARAGMCVTVLDPEPGDGATWAAAGMLAPVTEADFGEERLLRLGLASAALWPGFAAELEAASGTSVHLRTTGTLTAAYDADDVTALRRLLALHHRWGLGSEEVSSAEARSREPLLGPRVAGALWSPGDHQVDPRVTHTALRQALGREPGTAVVHRTAVRLLRDAGGRVAGAVDETGREHWAQTVVLAAGWRSGELLASVPEVVVPTRPVKGQTIRLDAGPGEAPEHVVRGLVQGRPVYVVPRAAGPDGRREVVVGATSEENPDDRRATTGGVFALLRDARALVPALDEATFVEVTPRARPATPDNLPIVGASGVPGLVLATGHHRGGVLLAPLTGVAIEAVLTGAAIPDEFAGLDPRRFSPDRSAPVDQPVGRPVGPPVGAVSARPSQRGRP